MANSLLKDTTIDTVVGYEQVPAIPFRPAVPPRTVNERRNVCMFRYSGPGRYVFSTNPQTGQVTGTFIPDAIKPGAGGLNGGLQGSWSCQDEIVPVTYPGTPAQPYVPGYAVAVPRLETGYNLGWNSGARSIAFFRGDGYVEFKVRASVVGVICGINFDDGVDAGYNGNTIDFAFYCARGQAWVIRNGALGTGVGGYTDATVFKIERVDAEVAFFKDGAEVFRVASGVPTEAGWLEASLYSGNDEVFDPKLVQVSPPDLTPGTGSINASLEPLTMFASEGMHAELNASLPFLKLNAEAGLVTPSYAVGSFVLPALSMLADGLTGEVGAINAELEPLQMLAADHPYGELNASLPPLTALVSAQEGNFLASMSGLAFASATLSTVSLLVVELRNGAILSADLVAGGQLSAELLSEAAVGSTFAVNALLEAVMRSSARAGDDLDVPGSGREVWVVNLDNNASTTYSNYDFNSFARIGGRYFGASDEGLFELAGATDSGMPIQASISLGQLDFGTPSMKTISECYVGMSGDGRLVVKITAEGQSYLYKTRGFGPDLKQQRVELGRGLQGNYLTLELVNEDGADFAIDTVQFRVADLKRKI
ncbi:hypothetical protein LJR099_003029 [Variovorax paradoxus]|uniref:hypothetical protein n=1 Tax=Variovorax paradoxus TaxID=34073 RepID=UPI00399B03AF